MGPSSGGTTNPFPPSVNLSSNFVSPNRFAALEPEYRPLCYIDVDLKAPESEEWRTTRAMVDCGGQGSFINDNCPETTNFHVNLNVFPCPSS